MSQVNAVQPTSEPKATIVNGVLIPDADSVRSMLWTLSQRMKTDTALAEAFRTDPLRVLGEMGLNTELQAEAAKSFGIEIPEGARCTWTCVISNCTITIL